MSITVANIQTAGDYFRRTGESNELTAAKALEAAALAIEDVHSQALFRFTQRRQTFDYLEKETDYSMPESLNVSDFKEVKDVRNIDINTFAFDYVEPNQFDTSEARYPDRNMYTVEYRDGQPILRISQAGVGSSISLHEASSYDGDGTWAVDDTTSDALNISTDSNIYRDHGGSIKFDVDVSQSGNNKATISVADMTAVDLSDYQGHATIRMWVYLPDVSSDSSMYIESVELRWGSSASAYWSATITKPADHNNWVDRWNLCEFKWNEATQTGTVDEENIDYILVTINYSADQPDDTGFRINDIMIYQPSEMELLYFSNATVKSSTNTGVWMSRPTSTSDLILAPDIYKPVYVAAYNYFVASLIYPADDKRIDTYERRYRGAYSGGKWVGGALERITIEQGERQKRPSKKLTPQVSWGD